MRGIQILRIRYGLALLMLVSHALCMAVDEQATMINPIAVPGLEPAVKRLAEQKIAKYTSLDEVPPAEYIRKDIPKFTVPEITGKTDEALVPDTCDLAERARLVVSHMTGIACLKRDGEIYYTQNMTEPTPRWTLAPGSGQLWPKYMEALPLMRIMSGSRQGLEVDKKWAEVILKSIGPDGLYYLPLAGRPWDPPGAFGSPDRGPFRGAMHVHGGRMLGVLALYYQLTGDKVWLDAGKKMVDGLDKLVARVDDKGMIFGYYYFPGDKLPADAEKRAAEITKKNTLFQWDDSLYTTWVVTGLAQFYRVSQYEPAKELSLRLARALRAQYPADGQWYGHQHCGTLAIQAFAELAEATGDPAWAELAKKTYEWGKRNAEMGALPSIGYFPVMQVKTRSDHEPMEPCGIGDMTAIACILTRLGVGDYWDDIDAYVRNGLIECQITRPSQVTDFRQRLAAGQLSGYGFWSPCVPAERPLAYNELADRFAERMTGMFSSTVWPNDMNPLAGHDLCCTGNDSRALYYAWENIVSHEGDLLKVNLLLNRVSQWADVQSCLPYTGRVEIKLKEPCRVQARMNGWINRDKVVCSVDGQKIPFTWQGAYIDAGALKAGQVLAIEFPIGERTETLHSFKLEYKVTFRGSDVVDLAPRGSNTPTYQRDYYRDDSPRFVKRERFTADKVVQW